MGRQKKLHTSRVLPALALVAALAVLPFWRVAGALLQNIVQRAAILSAVITMPEGSLERLRERFNDEAFSPDEAGPTQDPPQGQTLPVPAPSAQQEESASSQGAAQEVPTPIAPELPAVLPEIPAEYRGQLTAEDMSYPTTGSGLFIGAGSVKNYTQLNEAEILQILKTPASLPAAQEGQPQVLIIHTHATESFEPYDLDYYDKRNTWRSTDNTKNMVAVGAQLAATLRENGIPTLHDTTQHDYPSYNGAYDKSRETVEKYLAQYPSIRLVLDVHRDAIERTGGQIVKPTAVINGRRAAQLMVIACCDDGSGQLPHWQENFRLAAALTNAVESSYPTLTRPVFFCYRHYNQDLSPGSLLLEFGSHASTLQEALYTAQLTGQALAQYLQANP